MFVTRDRFMARVAADGFVEWTEFSGNGHLYGTPTMDAPDGSDVVLEIDSQGALQVKSATPMRSSYSSPLPHGRPRSDACASGATTSPASRGAWLWRLTRRRSGATSPTSLW